MADNTADDFAKRPPDPFVAARVNQPGDAPAPTFDLAGLLGDSDREGHRRLYLNTSLDYYVEFRTEDVVAVEAVAADTPPFVGLDATRVTLSKDAAVEYVRVQRGTSDFDLDAVGGAVGLTPGPDGTLPTDLTVTGGPQITTLPTNGATLFFCETERCLTIGCVTRQNTCLACTATCWTVRATCFTCGQATCQTCGQATCQTCARITCHTCDVRGCWPTITGVLTQAGCISRQVRCPTLACP